MGIFSNILKKTPVNVTAHILDPKSGYQTQIWTVGTDISNDTVSRLADGTNIYVVRSYKAGEIEQVVCKKGIWLFTKTQMDAIDDESQIAMARTKEKLDELRFSILTDNELGTKLATTYPHSLKHLQQLVMDSERCAKVYGKNSFDAEMKRFFISIGACVHGLVEDGHIKDPNETLPALESLNLAMWRCELTYSNWPDAFKFWKDWYFQVCQKHKSST